MGEKHRLDFSFRFSGGVFSERAPSSGGKWAQNTAWISILNFQAVFSASGRRLSAENGRRTPPRSPFLIFRRCFQQEGAVFRWEMGEKHRLVFSFRFSGGVFSERAPSYGGKWAQNTAWISVFDFQAVFSARGRRLTAGNGRKTPPGPPFLIFRRCLNSNESFLHQLILLKNFLWIIISICLEFN